MGQFQRGFPAFLGNIDRKEKNHSPYSGIHLSESGYAALAAVEQQSSV
jgi:hypothetical protein